MPARLCCVLLLAAACSGAADRPVREPTRAERDSMIGASTVLPGAAGVRGAIRAADTARARNDLRDSLAAQP